jgi:hypothetical protein
VAVTGWRLATPTSEGRKSTMRNLLHDLSPNPNSPFSPILKKVPTLSVLLELAKWLDFVPPDLQQMRTYTPRQHALWSSSTFRDWAAECTNFPRKVAEAALAHVVGDKVEAAYPRGDLFEKRRRLMDAWAVHCFSVKGDAHRTAVPLKKNKTTADKS